jgi:hypothetical protein
VNDVGCEQGFEISDGNTVETLFAVLQKYEQKVILILTLQHINLPSPFPDESGNVNGAYEDNCDASGLEANSNKQILGRTINSQDIDVALCTLVGTDLLECI